MPICTILGLTPIEIAYNTPPILAILIGIFIFVLSVRDHLFVSILALAAPAMIFIMKLVDMMSSSGEYPEWAIKVLFHIAVFGSPVLFSLLTIVIGFSRLRKRKLLFILCVSGLIAALATTKIIGLVLGQISG